MSGSKHDKAEEGETPFRSDLERNPGIGQSKGTTAGAADIDLIEGDNTVEGDVENDPDSQERVSESAIGRTNK
jgi:hypothetical protein